MQGNKNASLLRWKSYPKVLLRSLLFLCVGLSLVGCSSVREDRIQCPKTRVVAELSKAVEFQEQTPIRVDIDSITPSCTEGDNQILMELRVRFTALRPLTLLRVPVTITPSYFVAVVDARGNVLSRSDHEVELVFQDKKQTSVSFQRLLEVVPSPDALVYIGFNLNEEQHRFLQKERQKKVNDPRAQPH